MECDVLWVERASLIAQLVKNRLQCRRPWFDSWVGKIRWRGDRLPTTVFLGFPHGSAGKKILLQCGRPGFDPWVGKISWRRERLPTPIFWPGEFHGLHSPWGRKESDTTEQLSLTHWVDSVRVELNCRIPSWDQRIAWGCGTAPLPPTPMLYLGAEP